MSSNENPASLTLAWDSAGTDNPGDQEADSLLGGYYAIGPAHPTGWSATVVLTAEDGHVTEEITLGRAFATEQDAKTAALAYEISKIPTSPSGLTEFDDCDDTCAEHAPDCDGYCDHGLSDVPHLNACLPTPSAKPAAPATPANTNCLAGVACPNCGAQDEFRIVATVSAVVTDDGVSETTDFEWGDQSPITCAECGHTGTVAAFTITEENCP